MPLFRLPFNIFALTPSQPPQLLSDIDPLSLVEVDERGASAVDVAEKALQFPVMDGESGRARTQRGLLDP